MHSRGDHCDAVPQRTLALSAVATTTDGRSLLTFDQLDSPFIFCPLEVDPPRCLHVFTNVSKCRGNVKVSDMKMSSDGGRLCVQACSITILHSVYLSLLEEDSTVSFLLVSFGVCPMTMMRRHAGWNISLLNEIHCQ